MASGTVREIELAVSREARRYGVSKSFVIANALAFVFGIETETYLPKKRKRKVA
jgi:ABC-type multidrug transport system permease subunit